MKRKPIVLNDFSQLSALGIGATSFASIGKDTADSPTQRGTPKLIDKSEVDWTEALQHPQAKIRDNWGRLRGNKKEG